MGGAELIHLQTQVASIRMVVPDAVAEAEENEDEWNMARIHGQRGLQDNVTPKETGNQNSSPKQATFCNPQSRPRPLFSCA
jgi:hypothetical protein